MDGDGNAAIQNAISVN